jgi:hypothetical protein
MASLSTQFHATTEELVALVEAWMTDHAVCAAAVVYQPFNASPVTKDGLRSALLREPVSRLVFSEREIDCSASGNNDLLDKNQGALVLDIGRLGPRGLTESCLSTLVATDTWKRMFANLKKQTKAGVIGVHEQSGARGHYRNHRYTRGAKELFEKGTALRQFEQSPVTFQPEA